MPELNDLSFESLFREHYGRLCSFAYGYTHSAADAEEVVQSAFLALWSNRERIDVHTSLRAYLFASVRNHALNRSARARLEQRWYDEEAAAQSKEPASTEPTADRKLESAEVKQRVQAAIAELPPGCQR